MMDTEATLTLLFNAIDRMDYADVAKHAGDLAVWIDNGGFAPKLTGKQQKELWDEVAGMAARLDRWNKGGYP